MTKETLKLLLQTLSPSYFMADWNFSFNEEIDWFMEQDEITQELIIKDFCEKTKRYKVNEFCHIGDLIKNNYMPKKELEVEVKKTNTQAMLEQAMRNKGMKINY